MAKRKLTDDDRAALIAGLKSGLGLTLSASLILWSPQEITEYLKSNEAALMQAQEAVTFSSKVLMVLSNQYLTKKKFAKWQENNVYIRSFVARIHFWEEICKKAEVTHTKIVEAITTGKNHDEAATLVGMTHAEFNQYLLKNPSLLRYIKENANLF